MGVKALMFPLRGIIHFAVRFGLLKIRNEPAGAYLTSILY